MEKNDKIINRGEYEMNKQMMKICNMNRRVEEDDTN